MNAVAKIEAPQTEGATLLAVISKAASDPNTDVNKLERLMAMYRQDKSDRAEAEFNRSMRDAQSKMVRVSTDATNPQTRSNYATYGKLDRALRPIYTDAGFALSFDTDESPKPEHVRVLCYVSHDAGHCRTYKADLPVDGKGAKGNDVMTKTHAFGSGSSYGMRYLLKMIFNVAIGEDDADGNDPDPSVVIKANDWIIAVSECENPEALAKLKAECLKDYGMADKVPTGVRSAFVSRKSALDAKEPQK